MENLNTEFKYAKRKSLIVKPKTWEKIMLIKVKQQKTIDELLNEMVEVYNGRNELGRE